MNELVNKSEILFDIASHLNNTSRYVAVPHCAYYSCYQLMKHIWLTKMNRTENDLERNCSLNRMGSHEYLINQVADFIKNSKNKNARDDFRQINENIVPLKKYRIKADYYTQAIFAEDGQKSYRLSQKIIQILKKYQ